MTQPAPAEKPPLTLAEDLDRLSREPGLTGPEIALARALASLARRRQLQRSRPEPAGG
jgi:hypothetical protein